MWLIISVSLCLWVSLVRWRLIQFSLMLKGKLEPCSHGLTLALPCGIPTARCLPCGLPTTHLHPGGCGFNTDVTPAASSSGDDGDEHIHCCLDSLLLLPLLPRTGGTALAAQTHERHHCAWQRGLKTLRWELFDTAPCSAESYTDFTLKKLSDVCQLACRDGQKQPPWRLSEYVTI